MEPDSYNVSVSNKSVEARHTRELPGAVKTKIPGGWDKQRPGIIRFPSGKKGKQI